MRILLIGSSAAEAVALSELLYQGGHEVAICRNADDARGHFERQRSDLVIVDERIAGSDGLATAEMILQASAPRWQPVILLMAGCDVERWTRAMASGCDACLPEPLSPPLLEARLQLIERKLRMQQDAEAHLERISHYLAAEEEDSRLARHLVERQMMAGETSEPADPAVQYWHRPCARLAGDMLAVARGPNGVLYAMLADAGGRGLAAYVSLLPIIAPFRSMSEKGLSLGTIARELNRKLRHSLPAGNGVAAQLVAINARERIVSLWNGGMPTAFMIDAQGHHFHEFPLSHPRLGASSDADFDERVEQRAFPMGEQLVMLSDGLLEALSPAGERFGEQGLADVLVGHPRERRCAEASAALEAHLAGSAPADDMTLVLLDCLLPSVLPAQSPGNMRGELAAVRPAGNWSFELRLGAEELGRVDAVPLLLNVVQQCSGDRVGEGVLFVVLSELFNNALDHGILRLDSRLRASPDGLETWLLLREERLAALRSGEICLAVEQLVDAQGVILRILCRDSGPGFDVGAALDVLDSLGEAPPAAPEAILPFGRGLLLVKQLADSMEFNQEGNLITITLAGKR